MRSVDLKTIFGFTLAEMAVVVLIIGIGMSMGLKIVTASLENAAYSETKAKQERLKTALIGYLRTNRLLPCPDSKAVPDGFAVGPPCLANNGRGVIPYSTLGLPRDAALDGWGNYFTYRVSNRTPVTSSNWTINAGATAFTINELTTPLVSQTIQTRATVGAALTPITPNAVVVIVSHGKNGFGSRTIQGQLGAAATGADEITNTNAASTFFVSRQPPQDSAAPQGGIYDDIVAYMTPQDLLQPLVNERTLIGVCQAYCGTPAAGCTPSAIPIGATPATCP